MKGYSTVTIMGNMVHDIELKYPSGHTVAEFAVAVNVRKNTGGEWKDVVHYFDVVAFGKTAENAARDLRKGSPVLVSGRVEQNRWTTEGGAKRSKVNVVAGDVVFVHGAKAAVPPAVQDAFPRAQADDGDISF